MGGHLHAARLAPRERDGEVSLGTGEAQRLDLELRLPANLRGPAELEPWRVALNEIDPATMESRVCPGLFLVGEILDVDGRIGGFNFQWAWSSARVAARALGARAWDDGDRNRTVPVP